MAGIFTSQMAVECGKCGRQDLLDSHRGAIEIRGLNSGPTKRKEYADFGEIKRRIEDNETDVRPLVLEMGWPQRCEQSSEVVTKDAHGPKGMRAGKLIIAGVPPEADENLLDGSRLGRNWTIDMRAGTDEEKITCVEKKTVAKFRR